MALNRTSALLGAILLNFLCVVGQASAQPIFSGNVTDLLLKGGIVSGVAAFAHSGYRYARPFSSREMEDAKVDYDNLEKIEKIVGTKEERERWGGGVRFSNEPLAKKLLVAEVVKKWHQVLNSSNGEHKGNMHKKISEWAALIEEAEQCSSRQRGSRDQQKNREMRLHEVYRSLKKHPVMCSIMRKIDVGTGEISENDLYDTVRGFMCEYYNLADGRDTSESSMLHKIIYDSFATPYSVQRPYPQQSNRLEAIACGCLFPVAYLLASIKIAEAKSCSLEYPLAGLGYLGLLFHHSVRNKFSSLFSSKKSPDTKEVVGKLLPGTLGSNFLLTQAGQ